MRVKGAFSAIRPLQMMDSAGDEDLQDGLAKVLYPIASLSPFRIIATPGVRSSKPSASQSGILHSQSLSFSFQWPSS